MYSYVRLFKVQFAGIDGGEKWEKDVNNTQSLSISKAQASKKAKITNTSKPFDTCYLYVSHSNISLTYELNSLSNNNKNLYHHYFFLQKSNSVTE